MQNKSINQMKFKEIATEWLLFKKTKIKESTYLNYKYIVENRFSELREKTLEELKHYNFNTFIEKLMATLSNKTVKDVVSVLKGILRYSEMKYDVNLKLGLISSPSIYKKEIEIFNDKERKKIEDHCIKSEDLRDLGILLSLYAGLRIGEVCALKWENIDFENKLIDVTHTLQRVYVGRRDTKVIYTTPKTPKSIRKIPLSKLLYNRLKEVSKKYPKEAFVLTGEKNKWIEPLGFRYTYRLILKQSKVNYKKYHTLRHTFATRCIKVGMDIKSLSEVLGHANVTITLNIYVHSSFETKNKYINRL